jgi:hypothetical protein
MDYHHEGKQSKYQSSSPSNYSNSANTNGVTSPRGTYKQEESRSARSARSRQGGMEAGEGSRRSNLRNAPRSSSRTSTSRTRASAAAHAAGYSSPNTPSASANMPQDGNGNGYNHPNHHPYDASQSQGPMTHFDNNPNAVSPTPPADIHPNANAGSQVSNSYSQGSSQARRPAYLLHRDLVIGKGSYGQVCIASRGETEGQQSGSGKRKKFACKCVVLRNDAKYIAKLQEEVNVLRELRGHENVIRLYDVFCVDNELFIITELGRGGDLFHLLTTHPKHGVTEAYAGKSSLFCLTC